MSAESFTRRPWWRRWFGDRSERAAARFLRRLGYRVFAANVRDRFGEIDLLALDGDCLVIVEVRSTESDDLQRAAESVNHEKQRRLTEAALRFLSRRNLLDAKVRFDVLGLSWPPGQREPTVAHFPHAFEATGRFQKWS
jgi:putative endonuclease